MMMRSIVANPPGPINHGRDLVPPTPEPEMAAALSQYGKECVS
jgi:hypothetical protein